MPNDEDQSGLIPGTYDVQITDANLCSVSSSFTVSEPSPITITEVLSDISCYGGSDGSIDVSIGGGVAPYTYSWTTSNGSGLDSSEEDQSGLTSGSYDLSVTDENICSIVEEITIYEPDPISVNSQITPATCPSTEDGAIILNISGGTPPYSVLWSTSDKTANLTNIDKGKYTVDITDANLCVFQVSIDVPFEGEDCIEIPNVFIPNNDGFNDTWRIINIELYPNATVEVYSRWGQLVYSSKDGYNTPWDGTSKGKELPTDSYFYIIDLKNGKKHLIVVVTIIR